MMKVRPWQILCLGLLCHGLVQGTALGDSLRVVVITDAAGLGDKGFNDVCWQGVQRAKGDFGLQAQFLQSREQSDYVPNLTLAAQRSDVIVTLGYLFADAVKQVSPRFPKTRFVHIEGEILGENVACFDFKSEEGGFLAGLVAGLYTRSKQVGIVTGMDIPPVEAYVSGFRAGVVTAAKRRGERIEVVVTSAGSFNDPVKGKSLAQALMDRGGDVIFRAAGNTGIGVFEAVKNSRDVAMIAEDLDQDSEFPGRILTSTIKRMDVAVYGALRGIVEGRFQKGHQWLGAAEGAVGITEMRHSSHLFPPQDLQVIHRAQELLASGRLRIPRRTSEVESFAIPDFP